jgi:hypothetical protein
MSDKYANIPNNIIRIDSLPKEFYEEEEKGIQNLKTPLDFKLNFLNTNFKIKSRRERRLEERKENNIWKKSY